MEAALDMEIQHHNCIAKYMRIASDDVLREARSWEVKPLYFVSNVLYFVLTLRLSYVCVDFKVMLRMSYVRPRRWPNFHGRGQLVATVEMVGEWWTSSVSYIITWFFVIMHCIAKHRMVFHGIALHCIIHSWLKNDEHRQFCQFCPTTSR